MKLSMQELLILVNYYNRIPQKIIDIGALSNLIEKELMDWTNDRTGYITQKGIDLVNNLLKTTELLLTET